MLNEQTIEVLSERLVSRFEKLNVKILQQIGEKLLTISELTPTSAHQLEQLLKYGGDYDKIATELSKITNLSKNDIEKIFEEASKKDLNFAKEFYEYKNLKFLPYEENIALKQQVESIAKLAVDDFIGKTSMLGYGMLDNNGNVIYKGIKETYNDIIDEAIVSIAQGKETFQQAMAKQLETLGGGGLRVIYPTTYIDKNGEEKHITRRLDSVIRTNMQDSLRQLHNETQKIIGEQFGADGVEISVHMNPAIDHEQAQGHQFSLKEFEKLQEGLEAKDYKGKIITLDHDGKNGHRPISEMNCYHYVFSIVLGVSEPEYDEQQLQDIINKNNTGFELDGKHYTNYEGTQIQRTLERKIREQKDIQILARASGDNELVSEAEYKITQLTNKYKELSDVSGLPTKMQRMKVSGYKKVKLKNIT